MPSLRRRLSNNVQSGDGRVSLWSVTLYLSQETDGHNRGLCRTPKPFAIKQSLETPNWTAPLSTSDNELVDGPTARVQCATKLTRDYTELRTTIRDDERWASQDPDTTILPHPDHARASQYHVARRGIELWPVSSKPATCILMEQQTSCIVLAESCPKGKNLA